MDEEIFYVQGVTYTSTVYILVAGSYPGQYNIGDFDEADCGKDEESITSDSYDSCSDDESDLDIESLLYDDTGTTVLELSNVHTHTHTHTHTHQISGVKDTWAALWIILHAWMIISTGIFTSYYLMAFGELEIQDNYG